MFSWKKTHFPHYLTCFQSVRVNNIPWSLLYKHLLDISNNQVANPEFDNFCKKTIENQIFSTLRFRPSWQCFTFWLLSVLAPLCQRFQILVTRFWNLRPPCSHHLSESSHFSESSQSTRLEKGPFWESESPAWLDDFVRFSLIFIEIDSKCPVRPGRITGRVHFFTAFFHLCQSGVRCARGSSSPAASMRAKTRGV